MIGIHKSASASENTLEFIMSQMLSQLLENCWDIHQELQTSTGDLVLFVEDCITEWVNITRDTLSDIEQTIIVKREYISFINRRLVNLKGL